MRKTFCAILSLFLAVSVFGDTSVFGMTRISGYPTSVGYVVEFPHYIKGNVATDNVRIINNSDNADFDVKVYGRTFAGEVVSIGKVHLKGKGDKGFISADLSYYSFYSKSSKYSDYAATIDNSTNFSISLKVKRDDLYITIESADILPSEEDYKQYWLAREKRLNPQKEEKQPASE